MKKIILSVVAVLAFGFTNAQSNQKGGMHLNVMGGFNIGSANFKDDAEGSENETAFGIGADLRALSFGLNYRF